MSLLSVDGVSNNPVNLALRFILELVAIASIGYWGWHAYDGTWQIVMGLGLPLLAAVIWGTFRVPNDPGHAPVQVPGFIRLVLELLILYAGAWALHIVGHSTAGLLDFTMISLHYVVSYDRVIWLLQQ